MKNILQRKNSYLMSPIVNFINILRAAFAPIFFYQKLQSLTKEKLHQALSNEKGALKMLMKLI
jgi:hypothetical protein